MKQGRTELQKQVATETGRSKINFQMSISRAGGESHLLSVSSSEAISENHVHSLPLHLQ